MQFLNIYNTPIRSGGVITAAIVCSIFTQSSNYQLFSLFSAQVYCKTDSDESFLVLTPLPPKKNLS